MRPVHLLNNLLYLGGNELHWSFLNLSFFNGVLLQVKLGWKHNIALFRHASQSQSEKTAFFWLGG
jgi:hypothetical protein